MTVAFSLNERELRGWMLLFSIGCKSAASGTAHQKVRILWVSSFLNVHQLVSFLQTTDLKFDLLLQVIEK